MEEETWKIVTNTNSFYEISTFGRLKSKERNGTLGGIMVNCLDSYGYHTSIISVLGKKSTVKIHRLVAQAFIPNPENKPCVNHIDNNRHNNKVSNLEWVTFSENNAHMCKQKRNGYNKNRDLVTGRFCK